MAEGRDRGKREEREEYGKGRMLRKDREGDINKFGWLNERRNG